MSRSVRTPTRRPSACVDEDRIAGPGPLDCREAVREARARRDRHGLAPADDLISRSSRTDGTRSTTSRSVTSLTRRSVVRLTRRAGRPSGSTGRAGDRRAELRGPWTASLRPWIAAEPSGSSSSSSRRPDSASGTVLSKPIYAAGLDWLQLLAWRFAIGAALAWTWLLVSAARRAALRPARAAAGPRRSRPRRLVHGQRRHVLRRPPVGPAVARRRPRLPLPGDRRRPLGPVCDAAVRPAAVDRARDRARRGRPRARRDRPRPAAAGRRDRCSSSPRR